jgi:hypothetical protein
MYFDTMKIIDGSDGWLLSDDRELPLQFRDKICESALPPGLIFSRTFQV